MRWEYHIVDIGLINGDGKDQAKLNRLGDQGLELVSMAPVRSSSDGYPGAAVAVFKRPRASN